MARSIPENIPEQFTHDDLASAYRRGWSFGHGIACHNVPTIGDKVSPCVDWVGVGRYVTAENIREYHELCCHAAADNARQFSPFEFTAHEFNSADGYSVQEFDGQWDVQDSEGDCLASFDSEAEAQAYADALPTTEELWEAFEAGTSDAIAADLSDYTDEDYETETADSD